MSERIPIDKIIVIGDNPRHVFDERKIAKLADSIKSHGLLQPLIVRPKDSKYELVVGERRLRACVKAGLSTVKAEVRDLEDNEVTELRLIENIHRKDLANADKGDGVYALLEHYPEKYPTMKSVAKSLDVKYSNLRDWCKKSRKLSDKVRGGVADNLLTEKTVFYLLKYPHEIQDKLAKVITDNELSQEQSIKLIKAYDENPEIDLQQKALDLKGFKRVRVDLSELTEEARGEIQDIIDERKKKAREKAKEVPPDEERCIAITNKGDRCKHRRLIGKQYCGTHDPDRKKLKKAKPKAKVKETETEEPSVPEETKTLTIPPLELPIPLFEKLSNFMVQRRMNTGQAITYILDSFFEEGK